MRKLCVTWTADIDVNMFFFDLALHCCNATEDYNKDMCERTAMVCSGEHACTHMNAFIGLLTCVWSFFARFFPAREGLYRRSFDWLAPCACNGVVVIRIGESMVSMARDVRLVSTCLS